MARQELNKKVFFRHQGKEKTDVLFRVAPQAIRYSQESKSSVENTLGGYYLERLYSKDSQYSNKIATLTIEGTTGVGYRAELDRMKWIWDHQSDRKKDGSPADIYFFDLIETAPYQKVKRSGTRTFLINIKSFAYDESASDPQVIKFSFRCEILRDLLAGLNKPEEIKPVESGSDRVPLLTPFNAGDLRVPDLSAGFGATQ
jgi:hypothetical protein